MVKIYSLLEETKSCSDEFYDNLNKAALEMVSYFIEKDKSFIDDFMTYIKDKRLEKLRSFNEYAIEFLMIGVFLKDYYENASAFKNKLLLPFQYYNYKRIKNINENKSYEKIDKRRGKLINKYLLKKKKSEISYSMEDLFILRKWLIASNEFNEEVKRLNNWIEYLFDKDDRYIMKLLKKCEKACKHMSEIGSINLEKYIKDVPEYLKEENSKISLKEDAILKRKGKYEYYFNLISAEIMNMEYRDRYNNCVNKFIFLPGCLRKSQKECKAKNTSKGLMCIHCNKECNVNKITKFVSDKNICVYIIPHESSLASLVNKGEEKAVIGIACILNLMSGGWKAVRIGYIPQCVIIDYPGCKAHWQKEDIMTSVNFNKLIYR